ncbi:MAG: small multi-drug export protein [Candidatus Bipolaricaulota bacterium]
MTGCDWLITVLLSAAPVVELRGGLPYAIARGADPALAFIVAGLANVAVVPMAFFILMHLRPVVARVPFVREVLRWMDRRAARRTELIEKLGLVGLALFVSVPLPGTGAWTAAFVAAAAALPPRRAALSIALGVVIAAGLVTLISVGALRWFT